MNNSIRTISAILVFCVISMALIAQGTNARASNGNPTLEQRYQIALEQYKGGKSDPAFLLSLVWMAISVKDQKTADSIVDHFYKDDPKIDKPLTTPGYSHHFLDRVIGAEDARRVVYPDAKLSTSEPNWRALATMITKKFDAAYAERNALAAKADWSYQHRDYSAFAMLIDERLMKYPPHALDGFDGDIWILNVNAWEHVSAIKRQECSIQCSQME